MNLSSLLARPRVLAGCLAVLASAAAIGATPASADHSMETIVQDDTQFLHRSDAEVGASMDQLVHMGVDRVRVTAGWSVIAPQADAPRAPDFNASDPGAYPPHAWDKLDRVVRDAADRGLRVDIDIAFWAPLWATGDTAPGRARTAIDPARYASFAQAVATRYSGSFTPRQESTLPAPPPSHDASLLDGLFGGFGRPKSAAPDTPPASAPGGTALPAVDMFTIWNEPNLGGFLQPQWTKIDGRWQPESPHLYRRMVQAAYPAIKAIDPGATVLVGGTASAGGGPGSASIAPLRFLRELACVDDHLRPLTRAACANFQPLPGDGFANHPYSLMKSPDRVSTNPDSATISELPRLTRLLGELVDRGRLAPALRDVWLTEFGYETNDQVTTKPFGAADQARFLAWSEFLAWRTPHVRSFAQFLLRDTLTDDAVANLGHRAAGSWQSGLMRQDGTPKPAAASFPDTVWAQYGLPESTTRARRSRTTARTTVWIHLRALRTPTAVQVQQQGADGTWTALPGGGTTTDARGYALLRVPTVTTDPLRVTWQGSQGPETSPAARVQPVTRQRPQALRRR